jgi:hypothetical protein
LRIELTFGLGLVIIGRSRRGRRKELAFDRRGGRRGRRGGRGGRRHREREKEVEKVEECDFLLTAKNVKCFSFASQTVCVTSPFDHPP